MNQFIRARGSLRQRTSFSLLITLLLGVSIAFLCAEPSLTWLIPKYNPGENLLDTRVKFERFQAAKRAIWEHAPRNYLFRRIHPLVELGPDRIAISSVVGTKVAGYQRKLVSLKWDREKGWQVSNETSAKIDTEKVEAAYSLIKKHIIAARHGESIALGDVPGSTDLWECIHEQGFNSIIQGYQISFPTDKQTKSDYLSILKVLTGFNLESPTREPSAK